MDNKKNPKGNQKGKKAKKVLKQKDKTLLGKPDHIIYPVLEENELLKLKEILSRLVKESGKTGRQFATESRINVGLESSLRTINQKRAAVVIISLSIKPHCIVDFFARNCELKDDTVPLYAQTKFEEFCKDIFGFRSLALVFPKDMKCEDEALLEWIHSKRPLPKKVPEALNKKKNLKRKKNQDDIKSKIRLVASEEKPELKKSLNLKEKLSESPEPEKAAKTSEASWSGDFISFSSSSKVMEPKREIKLSDEKNILNSFLNKIQQKAALAKEPNSTTSQEKRKPPSEQTSSLKSNPKNPVEVLQKTKKIVFPTSSKYQPLVLHTLIPNPNRKAGQQIKQPKTKQVNKK